MGKRRGLSHDGKSLKVNNLSIIRCCDFIIPMHEEPLDYITMSGPLGAIFTFYFTILPFTFFFICPRGGCIFKPCNLYSVVNVILNFYRRYSHISMYLILI